MGGLKKALPITYWTFLIGAIAIAGVPPLAGFFSKDEILFRRSPAATRSCGSIGLVTSLLTATYMFRLVFLTFHGERRRRDGPARADRPGYGRDARPCAAVTAHGHGWHLHDAPPAMAIALIVLAIGSIVAGFVGVPHALGGSNRIERVPRAVVRGARDGAGDRVPGRRRVAPRPSPPCARRKRLHEGAPADESTELMLMALSSGIAVAGIGLAMYFWLGNRRRRGRHRAQRCRASIACCSTSTTSTSSTTRSIVRPINALSTTVLWKGADAALIDGSVNGVGQGRAGHERRAAPAAVGLGPRLRGVALPRGGSDSRLVFVAMEAGG